MPRQRNQPSIADVAAKAGVSPTTVSRVLNNRGYLSDETKKKVAEAMEALNYRPNEVARALIGKRTRIVGIILPTVALPFFGELAVHLEHALTEHGYRTLLCNSLGRAEIERDYVIQLEGNRVDGLITGAHNFSIPEYSTTRLPVVTIDRELSDHIPNVRADNFSGGRLATERLVSAGCQRPLLLTSRTGPHNLREAGYRSVLGEAGIEPTIATVLFGTPEPGRTKAIFAALDEHRGKVDGVFATDDLAACTAIEWARQRGVRIPDEFKVVGFDGTAAVRSAMPWLTTIRQPAEQIAHEAVRLLVERIEAGRGNDATENITMEFPVAILEGTTA
ncbi:MAG: LacI family DNA-binding transcriptional regulator [Ancrocorticia sp.]